MWRSVYSTEPLPVGRSTFIWTWCMLIDGQGICAGKHAIAEYLIQHQGFQLLELVNKDRPRIADGPDDNLRLQASEIERTGSPQSSGLVFETVDALLTFVTKRWRERWVTTDIWDGATLDRLLQRPFFLLVSVDAPISLRWKRFTDRSVRVPACCCFGRSMETVVDLLPTGAGGAKLILQISKRSFFGTTSIYMTRTLDALI